MFRVHNQDIRARFSTLLPPMVLRRKKSSKFNWNIFQLYRQEIIRTATQTVWGLLRWCPVPQKSSKFDRYNFKSYWGETITTAPQKVWVCFWYKTKSSGSDFQLCPLGTCACGFRPRKICQNFTETFSVVLVRNDKNYTPNSVGVFRVQN